jgi:hypothetical protein
MRLDGRTLTLLQNGAPVATVDLTSYKVSAAATPAPTPAATATPTPAAAAAAGPPFALWLIPLALIAVLAGLARRRWAPILPGRGG